MEYIRLKITPASSFATLPHSDTFFGQICYTLALMGKPVDEMLKDYEKDPFLVTSGFFPMGYASLSKPAAIDNNGISIETLASRKDDKKKTYFLIDDTIKNGGIPEELKKPTWTLTAETVTHTKLHRLTNRTGEEGFAPFNSFNYEYDLKEDNNKQAGNNSDNENFFFHVYIYVKDRYKEDVIEAIAMIGKTGCGKSASIGKGRFELKEQEKIIIDTDNKNSIYTLSHCMLSGINADKIYYTPFVRFGKYGRITAQSSPFKNPVVMAHQGAILIDADKELFQKAYIGKGIINSSGKGVTQGYSLYLPINREDNI